MNAQFLEAVTGMPYDVIKRTVVRTKAGCFYFFHGKHRRIPEILCFGTHKLLCGQVFSYNNVGGLWCVSTDGIILEIHSLLEDCPSI